MIKKLLLIGPLINKKDPAKTGGVIVLFEQLLNELQLLNIPYIVIDANSANYKNKITAFLNICYRILTNIHKVKHISVHGTAIIYFTIAPFTIIIAKLLGKRISLRKFAGNFDQFYEQSNFLTRKIIEKVLSYADYTFFETKYLVEYFKKWNKNTFWFPNVRTQLITPEIPRSFNRRFVFISHVSKGKGINQILLASQKLDKEYIIDIYGPIFRNEFTNSDFKNYNVSYKGPLEHNKVLQTLNKYDVLLMPSYRKEEGYPGIIIEAYSLGIPIISTTLPSIMEICEDGKEGILVEPKNSDQITEAILHFNKENYSCFSQNAFDKFSLFRSDIHTKRFVARLELV